MKFSELLIVRESVRDYDPRPVEDEKLEQLIEAVRLAPSASNSQPWTLILVTEPRLRERLARATFSRLVSFNSFSLRAPVMAVLTLERPKMITQIGGRIKDKEYPLIDIGIASSHLCLQAAELGLGTCMIGWFDEKKVKELLRIPKKSAVGLLLTIGYPAADKPIRKKVRKPPEAMSRFNGYDNNGDAYAVT
ncbi:MAG: nitroreductase family protein [Desulfovermiculus sp.]|nr:nitroreductase family protein [Desulfovermiculus sp.]